jgi:hypothetical protein
LPQAPQSFESVWSDTHEPLQLVRAVPHVVVQTPALQTWFAPQAMPQAPQFCASVAVSVQAPPHVVSPVGQAHAEAVQTVPPVHFVPHLPQLVESDVTSTHAPLQLVKPVLHDPTQAPALQTWLLPQAVVQSPQ